MNTETETTLAMLSKIEAALTALMPGPWEEHDGLWYLPRPGTPYASYVAKVWDDASWASYNTGTASSVEAAKAAALSDYLANERGGFFARTRDLAALARDLLAERDTAIREYGRIARRLDATEMSNANAVNEVLALRTVMSRLRPVMEALADARDARDAEAIGNRDLCRAVPSGSFLRALFTDTPTYTAQEIADAKAQAEAWAYMLDDTPADTPAEVTDLDWEYPGLTDLDWEYPPPRQTAAEFMAAHADDPGGLLAAGEPVVDERPRALTEVSHGE